MRPETLRRPTMTKLLSTTLAAALMMAAGVAIAAGPANKAGAVDQKTFEENKGKTLASEGLDANYADIANYAIFALILLGEIDKS